MADDLGYSDIGAFGGEISTPNLDALVKEGVALTDFYASPFCSPTRAMLMSGADNHQVGFGGMAELMTPQQRALPFPLVLQDHGYRTYMAGKWHLGVKEEVAPPNRGFDQSYALMHGGASHFDQSGIITFDANKAPVALYRENGKEVQLPKDMQGYVGNPAWPRWKELSPEQQRVESKRMAVYAAMVESMDAQIGRVIEHLKQSGQYDNTVVIFMSDNGADGNTVLDEGETRAWAHKHRDNSYENTGRPGSFVEYGPGWAQVGSTPFNLYKAFMYEGGISVPSIMRVPGGKRQGEFVRAPAHVTDIAPTILALAQIEQPKGEYRGRQVIPMQGNSMVDVLTGRSDQVHETFRQGWELNDLSEKHPEKLKELIAEYEQYAKRNGVEDFEGLASRPGYSNSLNYYKDLDEVL